MSSFIQRGNQPTVPVDESHPPQSERPPKSVDQHIAELEATVEWLGTMNSTLLDLRESVVLEEHQRAEKAEAELSEERMSRQMWYEEYQNATDNAERYIKELEDEIKRLAMALASVKMSPDAAQVAVQRLRAEDAEAAVVEWKQKAFDFGENRDNVQAAYDEKARLLREAKAELAVQKAKNKKLKAKLAAQKKSPAPDSPKWDSWVRTVIGRCPYHGMELTNGSWHMHVHCPRERY